MTADPGLSAVGAVFGAGMLASLSPCVYPLLPITVGFIGTRARDRKAFAIVSYASGQVAALVALGAIAVYLGETLGFTSASRGVNLTVAAILLLSGLISYRGRLPSMADRALAFVRARLSAPAGSAGRILERGLLGAFCLGASSALVASPCTSPILASVLAVMSGTGTVGTGLVLMVSYSLGFSSLFLTLGLGLRRLPKAGAWLGTLHNMSAVLMIAASAYYLRRAFGG